MKVTATKTVKTIPPTVGRKPYPKYKDTGSEWVPLIPEHWEIKRLKYLASEPFMYGANEAAEMDDPDLPRFIRITDISEDGTLRPETFKSLPEDVAAPYLLKPGDILFSRSGATVGKAFRYFEPWGKACFAGYLIRFRPDLSRIDPSFLEFCISTDYYWKWISSETIQSTIQNVSAERYANLLVPVPRIDEQRTIAHFLERETAKIEDLIAKKKRLIALLEAKRAVLIAEAVTRGLNPNVPMKDSAVEWIGRIPEHWELKKLKYVARFVSGGTPNTDIVEYWDGSIPWVSPKDMRSDFVSDSEDHITALAVIESATTSVAGSSLLVVVRSGILRHTIPAAVNVVPVTINQDIRGVLPDCDLVQAEYVLRLIQGKKDVLLSLWRKQGATVESLEYDLLANTPIPLPPLSEQSDICRAVRAKVEQIDTLIGQNQRALVVLREYRTSTITLAVSGQFDVHQTAIQIEKRSANPYFKRTVLAAEIVHRLHREPTFGHVKLQKLFFLIEHEVEATDFDTHYTRQAAGPLDRKLLFSIDRQLQQQKWYKPIQSQGRHMYMPMEHAGNHRKYYETHWLSHDVTIQRIISLFRALDTERCEIVATLYAAWNDILLSGQSPTDDQIVDEVVNHWHEKKQRIEKSRWTKALQWMRENNLVPKGIGTATHRS